MTAGHRTAISDLDQKKLIINLMELTMNKIISLLSLAIIIGASFTAVAAEKKSTKSTTEVTAAAPAADATAPAATTAESAEHAAPEAPVAK